MRLPGGIAAVLPLLFGAPLAAQEDEWNAKPPSWEGVWQGTVGTLPVHVCLNNTPYQEHGGYYYDRVKQLIRLERDKIKDTWTEEAERGRIAPQWHVRIVPSGGLEGNWTSAGKTLPVRLKRVGAASNDHEGPCGSMAFLGPRLNPVKLTSKKGTKDGARFTIWTFNPAPVFDSVELSTFTLDRPGQSVAKINALLRKNLPKADGGGDWLECMAGNGNHMSRDGTYIRTIEPTMVTANWLAANEHGEYYCGGAHPDNVNIPRTFDLISGAEVDLLEWFTAEAVHREELPEYGTHKTLTRQFVAMILDGWNDDQSECDEATRTQESWSAGIARGALVFSPNLPRVIMACGDDYKIPFARLKPWLNAKGKAAVASLPR